MGTRTLWAIVGSFFLVLDGSTIQYSALHHHVFSLVLALISSFLFFLIAVLNGLMADGK
jgi:ABC-type Na+ efflux pump permease subunit